MLHVSDRLLKLIPCIFRHPFIFSLKKKELKFDTSASLRLRKKKRKKNLEERMLLRARYTGWLASGNTANITWFIAWRGSQVHLTSVHTHTHTPNQHVLRERILTKPASHYVLPIITNCPLIYLQYQPPPPSSGEMLLIKVINRSQVLTNSCGCKRVPA